MSFHADVAQSFLILAPSGAGSLSETLRASTNAEDVLPEVSGPVKGARDRRELGSLGSGRGRPR
eukprot:5956163-Pyramimonas_sp.AAC.1